MYIFISHLMTLAALLIHPLYIVVQRMRVSGKFYETSRTRTEGKSYSNDHPTTLDLMYPTQT